MSSATASASTSNGEDAGNNTGGSLLKQTLLSIDEVFVYKIPPLRAHGGHRAEDWDLANPLQTCGFQVERRNNDLYLIFTTENHTKIFALSKYIPHTNSVEPVVDSSRYFVTQLVTSTDTTKNNNNSNARHVWIGFGFRNRDAAVDLLGVLQQFSKSIDRELEAKKKVDQAQKQLSQTKLNDGEKIHIVFGSKEKSKIVHTDNNGGGSNSNSPEKRKSKGGGGGGGGAFLLKKPPGYQQQQESVVVDTHEVKLPPTPPTSTGVPKSSQDSNAAVADTLGDSTDDDLDDDDIVGGGDVEEDDEWNDFQGA